MKKRTYLLDTFGKAGRGVDIGEARLLASCTLAAKCTNRMKGFSFPVRVKYTREKEEWGLTEGRTKHHGNWHLYSKNLFYDLNVGLMKQAYWTQIISLFSPFLDFIWHIELNISDAKINQYSLCYLWLNTSALQLEGIIWVKVAHKQLGFQLQ